MKKGISTLLIIVAFIAALVFTQAGISWGQEPTATPDHNAHHPEGVTQGSIWVANETGNSLSIIDASTNTVVTTLTGIEGPHNVQAAPDGQTVWAISGHDALAVKLNAATYTVLGTTPTGSHPAHIVVSPDGRYVYVTNGEDNTVSVINAETLENVATVPVGEFPHGLRPSQDGQWLYVANVNSNTVSVIDTATHTKVADIEVGQRPVQVGFSPDSAFVYVSLNGTNELGKIDVATQTLVGTVEVGVGPIQVYTTPDNAYVLVANQGTEESPSTTVSIVDTSTFTVVGTVETGTGAHGVVVDPSGKYAYITNIYADTVAVLDIATREVTATIPVEDMPNGITFLSLQPSTRPTPEVALDITGHDGVTTGESTAESENHDAHHPEATAESASTDMMGEMSLGEDMTSMMDDMQGMMSMMMDMEMSDEMRTHMEQMQSMMDMMMPTDSPSTSESDMTMTQGSGSGHAMEPISAEGVPTATENIGGQPLEYRLEDGMKVFELTAQPVIWNILDDVSVTAWTYNGTVPGPMIRVTEGDQVRIIIRNELPEATAVHWHGMEVPNAMDGVPGVTQDPIQPGETFTYEFTARPAGSFMYHSHFESDKQVGIGLYAPFIIDPAEPETDAPDIDVTMMLSEWRVVDGQTYPAMPMAGAEPNYFTINGKAFPSTETINVNVGDRVRIRLMNIGQFVHPMHLHGMAFKIVATDGHPVPEAAQLTKDTISIAPGERYDVEFIATEPGIWVFHCHILHHVTNDGVDGGGLTIAFNVTE